MKRLASTIAALFVAVSVAMPASAAQVKPYSSEALAAAQKENKSIVLVFHADWCPTCRAQSKVLAELAREPGLDGSVFLQADFDKEQALKDTHHVTAQSTVLVFKAKDEVARAIGVTDKDALRSLITKGR